MSQLTSLQTKVAGQILAAITSGDLQPGLHLKEVELAQRSAYRARPSAARWCTVEQKAIEPLPQQGYRVLLEAAGSAGCNSSRRCITKRTICTPG